MAESGKKHPIRIVARRTGTSETTLRAWERRYGAVRPERAETGRRLYSDEDIARLKLIREAVDAGRAVSSVATMSDSDLVRLVEEDRQTAEAHGGFRIGMPSKGELLDACFLAVEKMDARSLYAHINRALVKFPALWMIDEVIAPLLHRIGRRWREQRLSPRHEHMASSVVRTILAQLQSGIQQAGARTIVIGTPPGQMHDLGTQFVAALAASEGWNVINLGANVPAPDIVAAAGEVGANAVALSIVHPLDDAHVAETLAYLGEYLGSDTELIVGGYGAEVYRSAVNRAGGIVITSARALADWLS